MSFCQKCGKVPANALGDATPAVKDVYDPANLGGWVYCPVATSWGSEIWRSKPADYKAQTDIWYNDTEFENGYTHEWEAPEQVEFQKLWKFMGQSFQLTELNLPYAVSVLGWMITLTLFAIIGVVKLLARWEIISDEKWEGLSAFIKKKDYFEDEHSSDLDEGGSFLGGMTTVLFMVWAYSLLGLTAYFFIAYNELVNQALVPKTEEDVKSLRPDVIIKVLFVGYTGPCMPHKFYSEQYPNANFQPFSEDPMKYNPTESAGGDPLPDFSFQGTPSMGATTLQGTRRVIKPLGMAPDLEMGGDEQFRTVCSHKPGEFMAEYKCNKCIITSASISFSLECDGMWNTNPVSKRICDEHVISVQQISWKLHASAIIPQEQNAVFGRVVVLDRTKSFRGSTPTMVDISLIPAAFDDSVRQRTGKGYRVQYMLERQGDVASQAEFMDGRSNMVKFDMLLPTDIVQLELKIVAKRTMMMAFAEAGGLFGAVAGLVIVMMNSVEVGQAVWQSITKREDDSESSEDSESDDVSSSSEDSTTDSGAGSISGSGSGSDSDSDASAMSGISASSYGSGTEGASSGAESSASTASRKNRRKSRLIDSDEESVASAATVQTSATGASTVSSASRKNRRKSRLIDSDEESVASTATVDTSVTGTSMTSSRKQRKGSRMEDETAEPAEGAAGSFAARRRASRMQKQKEATASGGESSAAPSGEDSEGSSVPSSRGSRPNRRKSRFVSGEEEPAVLAARAAAQAVLNDNLKPAPTAPTPGRRKSRSGGTKPTPGGAKRPGARRS
jgi:hypothetical protein